MTPLDDLFSTDESRAEAQLEKVVTLNPADISDFPNHPFKVKQDEAMAEMVDSVKQYGVLVPALVRPKADGGYEMVAGHRRKCAATLAGITEMPCMPYIPPEVVVRAREMDLLTYLRTYEPQELVHFGGNTYCTREHDSLKISNGKWCWFSRGIGGYSALDYLIKVKEMPFTQAVETIMGNLSAAPPAFAPAPKVPKEKVLLLPQVNCSATHAVEYLHRRGIDYELIDFCIRTGRLYESYPYHNVVFVGMDADGKPRYANQRGIGSDFIGDANGSDKHYSFGIPAAAAGDTLHLFESAVDLLSYGTLQKLDGKDWRSENLLSLAGVYKPRAKIEESSLPAALVRYLAEHPHIRRVVLRLDNDATGRIAAETVKTLLPRKYAVTVDIQPPPQGKDYNDCLCMRLGLPITKRRERSKER